MLITNWDDYVALCDRVSALSGFETIAIDTETTGVQVWTKDVLRGVCIGFRGESFYVPVSHPDSWNVGETGTLLTALRSCDAMPVYANAPFDFRVLEAGIGLAPPLDRYRDVQVISWLMDENRRKALKYLGSLFFGEDEAAEQRHLKALMKSETQTAAYKRFRSMGLDVRESKRLSQDPAARIAGKTWATFTAEDIAQYAAHDADLTDRVYRYLLAQPEYAEIEPAVQRQHDVQAAAYRMTRRGVMIDAERARTLADDARHEALEIADGYDVSIASAPQLAVLIYETWGLPVTERTDGGKPSTAAAVLEAMAGEHAGLDGILEYRRLVKAAQFYEGLLEHADSDGRVHTGFSVNGTVTGRWSSREPNLQQIPKASTNKDAKELFVAPPGFELVSFDLASAELRVIASLADDTEMMASLDEPGRSFHRETARAVFGTDAEPFYTLAKNLNYGISYGIGPKRFSTYIAKGRKEKQSPAHYRQAKDAIDAHRAAWPKLHAAIQNCSMYADLTGRLPLGWPGRFRHFTSPTMSYPVPAYQAINSAVQGGVALFMNDLLLASEGPAAELGAAPVLAVHDSLVWEAPVGTSDALSDLLQRIADDINPWKLRMILDRKAGV